MLFQDNTFLTHIDLSHNNIGSEGVFYIARGLRDNQYISRVVSSGKAVSSVSVLSASVLLACLLACLSLNIPLPALPLPLASWLTPPPPL